MKSFIKYGTTALALGFALVLPATNASAQPDESVSIEEALQICAGIKRERDRLDCFEGLASAAKKETPQESSQAEAPSESTQQTDAPVAVADPEDEQSSSPRFVILPAEEARERLTKKLSPGQKRKKFSGVVRRAWYNGERRLFILLANGELWKQVGSRKPQTPKVGDSIELRPATFGGWFVETRDGYPSIRMSLINAN